MTGFRNRHVRCVFVNCIFLAAMAAPAAAGEVCPTVTIGGIGFPGSAAFADDAVVVSGTPILNSGATSLADAVAGTDLSKHVTADAPLVFDVIFSDNQIVNGPGDDLVVFELTAPNPFLVAVQTAPGVFSSPLSVTAVSTFLTVPTDEFGPNTPLNAARIDLDSLGLPLGFTSNVLRITIADDGEGTFADVTAFASLNSPGCDDEDGCTIDICVNTVCTHIGIPNPADTDMDGVPDCRDLCPETPQGTAVDVNGCPATGVSAGGPYSAPCSSDPVVIQLNGSVDGNGTLAWTTTCTDATFSDPSILNPTLTIPPTAGCPLNCMVVLSFTPTGGSTVMSSALVKLFRDCNNNGIDDAIDISEGTSEDCNNNGIPDECDLNPADPDGNGQVSKDCNDNSIPDECDTGPGGGSEDCNDNGIPDECDLDASDPDGNSQTSKDCNNNGIPDECDIGPGGESDDCNGNGVPDECDIAPGGGSKDCNNNDIPDECDVDPSDPDGDGKVSADCNNNGIPDSCDVHPGDPDGNGQVSNDCNHNTIPDECDINPLDPDGNGLVSPDCNGNQIPDECDLNPADPDHNGQVSQDCDRNFVPDECQVDTDDDGIIDPCEDDGDGQPVPPIVCQERGPAVLISPYFAPAILFPLPFCSNGCLVGLPMVIAGITMMKMSRRRRIRRRR